MNPNASEPLLVVNWLAIGFLALCIAVGASVSSLTINLFDSKFILVLLLAGFLALGSGLVFRQKTIRWPKIAHAANVTGQMLIAGVLFLFLSYIAASANYPLQDVLLQEMEGWVPLDWQEVVWLANHYRLGTPLLGSYTLLQFLFLVPLGLCLSAAVGRAYEFSLILICTLAITVFFSALLPAVGPFGAYAMEERAYSHLVPIGSWGVDQMLAVRNGSTRTLALGSMTGIITFPSFHAAAAVVFLWGIWAVRGPRILGSVAGIAMLLSTPVIGGHYFVDVIAGGLIAIFSIVVVRRLSALLRSERREKPSMGAPSVRIEPVR